MYTTFTGEEKEYRNYYQVILLELMTSQTGREG